MGATTSGVTPISLPFRNTLAPAGRESTASEPGPVFAGAAAGRAAFFEAVDREAAAGAPADLACTLEAGGFAGPGSAGVFAAGLADGDDFAPPDGAGSVRDPALAGLGDTGAPRDPASAA